MNFNVKIIDCQNLSAEEIVQILEMNWQSKCKTTNRSAYYCGIAQDPNKRLQDHERDDWSVKEIIAVADCGTQENAAAVEGLMSSKGFDVGDTDKPGNGGGKHSTFVYLVHKGLPVNDTLSDFLKNIK